MKENARQGFWNGARPPLGYRIVDGEQRGTKMKKPLEIDPMSAETVRLIYWLALEGADGSGPLGVKSITKYLNEKGYRTRDDGLFGIASTHQILTRETYIGRHRFNYRDYLTKAPKPEAEHAIMEVPRLCRRLTSTRSRRCSSRAARPICRLGQSAARPCSPASASAPTAAAL